jgi:hypothetical protein
VVDGDKMAADLGRTDAASNAGEWTYCRPRLIPDAIPLTADMLWHDTQGAKPAPLKVGFWNHAIVLQCNAWCAA